MEEVYLFLKSAAEKANTSQAFKKKVARWDRVIQLRITDIERCWTLIIEGSKVRVEEGSTLKPHIKVETNLENFKKIVSGSLKPSNAFLTGRLKVDGTIPDLFKLNSVFKMLVSAR